MREHVRTLHVADDGLARDDARPRRDHASLAGSLSGLQFLDAIVRGSLPQAPVSETLTFWLASVGNGTAAFEGEPGRHLLNPVGIVHGGWVMTLIDSATYCAAMSVTAPGASCATVETKTNFSRVVTPTTGRVRCEARVVAAGSRIISCEAVVRDVQGAHVLAHGTSTILVTPPSSAL